MVVLACGIRRKAIWRKRSDENANQHLAAVLSTAAGDAGTGWETHPTEIARWLAMGCQIHLLTSHLVWYHYFVLSLPAILVLLKSVVSSTSAIRHRVILSLVLLWCLVLLGIEPLDGLLSSPPEEHFLRCLFANTFLLALLVWIED